jgi:hypothetical protein
MKKWLLLVIPLVSLALVYYPLHVIRPFRAQGSRELQAALVVAGWSPWMTLALAAVCVWIGIAYWKRFRTRGKLGIVFAVLLTGLAAAGSRLNVYEKMFKPVGTATFIAAVDAKYAPTDMVMSVHINGATRAYPVRAMGYHHVLNDVLADEPIVATY